MSRIWILTTSYPATPNRANNAGILARQMALQLHRRGHQVRVITPKKPLDTEFDPTIDGTLIPWLFPTEAMADIRARSPIGAVSAGSLMMSAWWKLRKLAHSERPDGVIALWAIPSGLFASWIESWTGAPFTVWILGSDVWQARQIPLGVASLRYACRKARAVFADSPGLAEEAHALTGRKPIFLPSVIALPEPVFTEREPSHFLYVGRYHPNKGPDVLVRAAAICAQRQSDLRVTLYGDGPLRLELERLVSTYGMRSRVTINSPIDRRGLSEALARATCLVIPSRVESIPMIMSDSAQARTPLIATNVGDLGSIGSDIGAIIVPPDDPDALADAMLKVAAGGAKPTLLPNRFDPEGAALEMAQSLNL